MFTLILEFTAIILFSGCLWHAAKYNGRAFAQQWFIAGYLAAILRETILQTAFSIYFFAPTILRIGAAPALVTLLSPSIFYLAFQFALRMIPPLSPLDKGGEGGSRAMLGLIFLIATSIGLPLEATAVQARWWTFGESAGRVVLGAPIFASLIWGGSAVIFYWLLARVRATNLPDRGKLYAMIVLASVIAGLQVIWTLLLSLLG